MKTIAFIMSFFFLASVCTFAQNKAVKDTTKSKPAVEKVKTNPQTPKAEKAKKTAKVKKVKKVPVSNKKAIDPKKEEKKVNTTAVSKPAVKPEENKAKTTEPKPVK